MLRFFQKWQNTGSDYVDAESGTSMRQVFGHVHRNGMTKILREMREFEPSHVTVHLCTPCEIVYDEEEDKAHIIFAIMGPRDTPYAGGLFFLKYAYSRQYPFTGELDRITMNFLTPILHPNISIDGRIDLDILGDRHSPSLSTPTIFLSLISFLGDPYPGCSDRKIGFPTHQGLSALYVQNYPMFYRLAAKQTVSRAVVSEAMLKDTLRGYDNLLQDIVDIPRQMPKPVGRRHEETAWAIADYMSISQR